MQNYDCIVIGGGLVGSQAVYRLSQTPGYKVAMLEQYPEGPSMGASFGETRIVRAVEWEVDIYTPMVLRSLEIYHALNAECAAYGIDPVFYETGGLYGGPADSDIFKGAQESVIRHNIPHDILDAAAVKKRFPVLNIPDDYKLVHDKQSGILVPERMLEFHYMLARQNGADLHFETRFKDISSLPDGRLLVTTNKGQFTTKKLIIAAGAWSGKLLEDMGLRCVIDNSTPERGYVAWIDPADDDADYRWENLPVLTIGKNYADNFYGFPVIKNAGSSPFTPGIKIGATRHKGEFFDPDPLALRLGIPTDDADEARVRKYTDKYFPATKSRPVIKDAACVWTDNDSPSEAMFLGTFPDDKRIIIACGDNGEGARLSGAVAEIVSRLAQDKPANFDLSSLSLERKELQTPCHTRHVYFPVESIEPC